MCLLVLAGALVLPAGARSSRAAGTQAAASQVLDVYWQLGTAITVTLGDGTPVTPNSVIPPGSYAVVIYNDYRDDLSIARMFHLIGPGVNVQTDLNQGEEVQTTWALTFQPSSTYTWQDDYRPSQVSGSFHTSAAAASSPSSSSPSGSTSAGSSPSGKPSPPSTSNSSAVGSAIAPFRGPLAAAVSAAGKLTLTRNGKNVNSLKSGRYTITVVDQTPKSGFTLQEIRRQAVALTGPAFVGKRAVTVTLKAGQWFFFSAAGKKSYFFVTN